MLRRIFVAGLIACLAGCATASKEIYRLSVGAPKAHVLDILGSPNSAEASGDTEILYYRLREGMSNDTTEPYRVYLRGGKVEKYGQRKAFLTQEELAKEEAERAAARNAFVQGYFNSMGARMAQPPQPRPAFTPMPAYQMNVPTNTSCTTTYVGGIAQTNCSSR